ncbi:hypothetical protein BD770DRAFT_395476 [Pilaira anomala]|nr:hypothetical protein BD770DRAFT_395476 [Pilaira anomala]
MVLSFALPRYSGSTLEPSSEPIMLYEPQYYLKGAGRATDMKLIPTRPTPPLKRNSKPPHITIPKPTFDQKYIDDDQFSAWSYEEDNSSSVLSDSMSSTTSTTTTTTTTTSYTPL